MIGLSHPGTGLGTLCEIIGSRKTVPPRIFLVIVSVKTITNSTFTNRMVPLGDLHMLWAEISGGNLTEIEVANLEFELLHTCFIRCDCGAFHTN